MNNKTDITIILDRSGSMGAVKDDTIGGFNAFVDEQKSIPGEASLTLVQFDDKYEVVYAGVPLRGVRKMTGATFVPRGSTALLDAIGRTINEAGARLAALGEADRPAKVLVVIMTDGEENASREFSRERVFDMISHQRDKYAWQVAFVGANQDAVATGASIGIPVSNSLNYASTGHGTQVAMASLSASTRSYRMSKGADTDNFFGGATQPEPAEAA